MYIKNNNAVSDQKIAINTCKTLNTYLWTINSEGRIASVEDPSLCIEHSGLRVKVLSCDTTSPSQRWTYSLNGKRILKLSNMLKGLLVSEIAAAKNVLVNFELSAAVVSDVEKWDIKYVYGGLKLGPDPVYDQFRIVSDLTTGDTSWCIYPNGNTLEVGKKLAIGACQNWKSYKWHMDSEGKLMSFKDTTLCIGLNFNTMVVQTCESENIYQRWAYSVLDKKLVSMNNGLKGVSVNALNPDQNVLVNIRTSDEAFSTSHQIWELEEASA